jgi:hypothetical protein
VLDRGLIAIDDQNFMIHVGRPGAAGLRSKSQERDQPRQREAMS